MTESNNSSTRGNRTTKQDKGSFDLDSAYGSVKGSRSPEDWDQVSRNAKDAKAEKTVRVLREQCGL